MVDLITKCGRKFFDGEVISIVSKDVQTLCHADTSLEEMTELFEEQDLLFDSKGSFIQIGYERTDQRVEHYL